MHILTTRFGGIDAPAEDVLEFPHGLIGLERWRHWMVLADSRNRGLGWLQSTERPDLAFAIVSPRRFVPGYRVRVAARDLAVLGMPDHTAAQVVVTVSHHPDGPQGPALSLNLKAPVVVCLESRRGRQVIAKDNHEVRHWLGDTVPLRRTA